MFFYFFKLEYLSPFRRPRLHWCRDSNCAAASSRLPSGNRAILASHRRRPASQAAQSVSSFVSTKKKKLLIIHRENHECIFFSMIVFLHQTCGKFARCSRMRRASIRNLSMSLRSRKESTIAGAAPSAAPQKKNESEEELVNERKSRPKQAITDATHTLQ